MVASCTRESIGRSGEAENLKDGTSIRGLSPFRGPLGIGVTSPDCLQSETPNASSIEWLMNRLRNAGSGEELQWILLGLFGPQCFSAGVIVGIGTDIISSVADLLKLAGKFVLADLYDITTRQVSWWRYADPTVASRLLVAKLAESYFGDELRQAAMERDALIKELTHAFENPRATFEGLADDVIAGYEKDWKDFKTYMTAGTLEGLFRAGKILGKLLVVVLGLLTGVVGAARVSARVATRLPRLLEHARAFKLRRGPAPRVTSTSTAQTPSQTVVRAGEAAQAKPTLYVLGRQADTAVAKDWASHSILDIPDWTLAKNDAFIKNIVDTRGTVYLGSPQNSATLWDAANNRMTVFARELEQLKAAGYRQVGDYMYPPTQ